MMSLPIITPYADLVSVADKSEEMGHELGNDAFVPFSPKNFPPGCFKELATDDEVFVLPGPLLTTEPLHEINEGDVEDQDVQESLSDPPSFGRDNNDQDFAPSVVSFRAQAQVAPIFRFRFFIPIPASNNPNQPVHLSRQTRLLRRGLNRNETTMIIDTFLRHIEWTEERQERNELDIPVTENFQWVTQHRVLNNESFARQINLGLAFQGLQIQTNFETKTFSETETTRTETRSLSLTIPPRTQIFFYARLWHFVTRIWFINSWPGEMAGSFTVGNNQRPSQVILRDINSTITAQENMWRHEQITGTTTIQVRPPQGVQVAPEIHPWNRFFPSDVEAALRSVGIHPNNE